MSDIKTAERKLAELRSERIALESRVDSVAVKATSKRASELLLSHETTALRSLDSMLTASQEVVLAPRDRFLSLGARLVRRRADAELVVVVRVDSGPGMQHVEGLTVQVDSAPAADRRYSDAANDALSAGAVDEVYHSNVLPATHAVTLTMSLNGSSQTKAASVDVPTGAVTYVQFQRCTADPTAAEHVDQPQRSPVTPLTNGGYRVTRRNARRVMRRTRVRLDRS